MKKLKTLLLSCFAFGFAACEGPSYQADVGAMFAVASGEVALQNSAGSLDLGSNQNDLDSNMGLGDTEPAPYVRLQMDTDKHRVRLHGFGLDTEGSGTLAGSAPGTGDFGDILAGTPVTTAMEFFAINANYGYELWRTQDFRIAGGLQLAFYKLDVAARSAAGREEVQTDALVPMPFIEVEGFRGPFTGGFNAGIMALDVGDGSGRYWDAEVYLKLQGEIDRAVCDVMVGYRYILLDAYGEASGRDFDADVDVQGVFVSAGIKF
ncbi:MAG TPA: hypothetical protein VF384_17385 [Planctomycetota bacterium]